MKKALALILVAIMCLGLCACKSEKVKNVEKSISDIGEVTLESEALIIAAEEAYAGLSKNEQKQVENYSDLEAAREEYDIIVVRHVESLISGIGKVTIDSEGAIQTARAAYDKLNTDQKVAVNNSDVLVSAESTFTAIKTLSANAITNYKFINAKNANLFDEDIETWYGDSGACATLFVCFQLQGISTKVVESSKLHMDDQHVCICREDDRVDIYAPYGNDQIMGIQYWPTTGLAKIGTVTTDITIEDYLELLTTSGTVDSHHAIEFEDIVKVINMLT